MAWDPLTTQDTQTDEAWDETKAKKVKDSLDYLYGQLGTLEGGLKNGSFEIYSIVDGLPVFNSWDVSPYQGGSYSVGTTTGDIAHGVAAIKFTHPGGALNGGGNADSDYIPCAPLMPEALSFIHWASNPAMKNQVYVRYFDKDKIFLSETQLYSSTANPSTATPFQYQHTPPASAQFYKVRIIGGYTDTNQPGNAFFDGIKTGRGSIDVIVPRKFAYVLFSTPSGSFVNITNALFKFYLPKGAYKYLVIRVRCDRSADGPGENYPIRFGIGSNYSSEYTVLNASGWQLSDEMKLDISALAPGFYTVQFQFHTAGVDRTIKIHMDDADVTNDPGNPGTVEQLVWLRTA